ncbi:MFS transporter [Nocardioides sp. Kera G14]|uniref:MFS transporter n=1 Tax=Nocardioides sp. Kera G14 TaxID=2884264 RepID=UPI001D0FB39B|nr:MFS transporter [Nocardioides sp. Kera G14]UDY25348.1 MFS transporter [Nocardioides sp. Kera G14]
MTVSSPWRCLRRRDFALWSTAHLVSGIGTWMQLVAQSLLVLHLTGSPSLTGLTLSLQAAPGLLLGVVGGALVDRLPRRATVAASHALLAAVALVTAVLAASDHLSVPVLLGLAFLTGAIATVDGPATALLGCELVPERDVPSAIALGSVSVSAGRVIGTSAAAVVIAVLGIPAAYAFNGLSFLAVVAVVPFVRSCRDVPTSLSRSRGTGLREGFTWLWRSPALLGLLVIGGLTSVLGRNYTLSFATLVTGPFRGDAADFGLVSTVLAVGAVAGAVAAGRLREAGTGQVASLALVGALLQVIAAMAVGLPMLVAIALPLALVEAMQDTIAGTVLQTGPPAHLRGRVLGAWQTAAAGWTLVGPPLFGWMLGSLGPRNGLALGGAVIAVVVLSLRIAARSRARRREFVRVA